MKYRIDIFHSGNENAAVISERSIKREYSLYLDAHIVGTIDIDKKAFSPEREQYDANILLRRFDGYPNLFLWVVDKDIYIDGMNFIFGCAIRMKGAILSTYRLGSEELIEKETVHEVGHVLGLGHCSKICVMNFSNNIFEAMAKPKHLCADCKEKLKKLHRI